LKVSLPQFYRHKLTRFDFQSLNRVFRTFRFRLAVWNAAVVILTAVVTLIVLRQGVRWAMLREMDQILIEDIDEVALGLSELSGSQLDLLKSDLVRKAAGHKHHDWFVQLFDENDRLVWGSAAIPELEIPLGSEKRDPPYTVGEFRLAHRKIGTSLQGVATIRVGASLRFVHEDMARIDRMVITAAGLVLVIAPATGFWLASRAVNPLSKITQTAARLRPSHLQERLPIRGTDDELDQLARTVNGFLDRIAAYLQQKRDFLAHAAHELRTPLAAIRSSVEVALNSDRSRDEYEDLLIDIIDEGAALETLVNQLLLISETEAEHLKRDYTAVMLDDVIAQSVNMFQGVAESRDIALESRSVGPVPVLGNRNLLRQLVNNLVDNAIKYTPPGGRVTVELNRDDRQAAAVLTVADTGIGIAPDDIPRVFDRFFRADWSRGGFTETVGTGLGLSICRAVTIAHGGEIICESKPGVGTQFVVRLPAIQSPLQPADDDGRVNHQDAKK
jgi:signal transduction histidine kinase